MNNVDEESSVTNRCTSTPAISTSLIVRITLCTESFVFSTFPTVEVANHYNTVLSAIQSECSTIILLCLGISYYKCLHSTSIRSLF